MVMGLLLLSIQWIGIMPPRKIVSELFTLERNGLLPLPRV